MTLIEIAARDWSVLEAGVREAATSDIETDPERMAKLVNRAVNSRYLTKETRPSPGDEGIFIGALLQRYVEEMDSLEPDDHKRLVMIGKLALTIDGLRGFEWDRLKRYEHLAPELKTKNVYTNWSDAAAESAKLIRKDLGTEAFSYGGRKDKAEERATVEARLALGLDVVEGFEDMKGTIIDLLHDDAALGVSPDIAAALIVGLGIETPTRSIPAEKLEAYKTNILRWLSMELSHTPYKTDVESTLEIALRGRSYLTQVAARYPVKGELSAAQWIVMRHGLSKDNNEYVRHVESYMAFALHDMFTHPQ